MNLKVVITRALFAVAMGFACVVTISAQAVETGFLNRMVLVDGVEYRYQVTYHVISGARCPTPLSSLFMAGAITAAMGFFRPPEPWPAIRRHADRFPAIVVFPQSHLSATDGWHSNSGEAALAELDKAIAEFDGDRSRVYLTGFPGGGHGAWYLASHHPERFAALVVVCGYISARRGEPAESRIPRSGQRQPRIQMRL